MTSSLRNKANKRAGGCLQLSNIHFKHPCHIYLHSAHHPLFAITVAMSSANSDLCTVCNKSTARSCNQCKSAHYCSTICQQADWPLHKLLCAHFSSFDTLSRPTNEHFKAFFFPVDDKKPKVFWLHCKWRNDDDGVKFQHPEFGSLLGPDAFPSNTSVQRNPVLKRDLSDTIIVCYRDTFLVDGSKANSSIAGINATKPGQYHDWRGPVIAYGKLGLGIDPTACKDLDMNAFRHITDFFLTYNSKPAPATQKSKDIKVKGVKINCIGDETMFNKPHYEAIEVSSTDPIFFKHDTSDIAKRIGLPIFTRRCPPNSKWVNDQDKEIFEHQYSFNNQDATFLHLCCDPKAQFNPQNGMMGWGFASQQWQNKVGSTIVVRQDKKPLSPFHVEALCKYCRYEIGPLLAHSVGEYAPDEPLSKNVVLSMICRPTFSIKWYKLLEAQSENEEDVESAPFPYDV